MLTPVSAGETVQIDTRPAVKTSVYWHATENATHTLFLFPGGGGGYGRVNQGWPQSRNFLVRTTQQWVAQGFNVAIFGKPSDNDDLDYPDRIAPPHLQDIQATLAWLKQKTATPIWFVGTSRGTLSVAHALIHTQDARIAGAVLSSSVVQPKKIGNLPSQALDRIAVPVLVYHHANDACPVCRPADVPTLMQGLTHAPRKQLKMVSGGTAPEGNPCEALHHHGYIGMETQAVSDIAAWIQAAQR